MPKRGTITKKDMSSTSLPSLFNKIAINVPTQMIQKDIDYLQNTHIEKNYGIKLFPCGPNAKVNRPPADSDQFFVYYDQFRLGLHFPLCKEMTEVLKHYGLVLAQLQPNSVASVMTFIVYLRRIGHKWTLEFFHQHFVCKIRFDGYASFSTTAALSIEGLDNKLENWKKFFCLVSSPADVEIPRHPSNDRVSIPSIPDKDAAAKPVLKLDIRQYVKDKMILLKVLYPGTYVAMTAEEWEISDKGLENLPKGGQSFREPIGRTKDSAKLKVVEDAVNSVPDFIATTYTEEIVLASPSTAGASSSRAGPSRLSTEQALVQEEEALVVRPPKRRRLVKGKRPLMGLESFIEAAADASGSEAHPETSDGLRMINPKLILSSNDKMIVDLSKDWYPEGACPAGVAQSMGVLTYSDNLNKEIMESTLSQVQDQLARHTAAAWNISNYLGIQLRTDRQGIADLEKKVDELKEANNSLTAKNQEKARKMEQSKALHEEALAGQAREFEEKLKEILSKVEAGHDQKVAELKVSNKKLKQKVKDLKVEAAENAREGIALCLDTLFKARVIPPEWNYADKIEAIVAAEAGESEAVPGGGSEEEDSEATDSDVASTTGK